MLTFYCPSCWQIIDEGEKTCHHCGYSLETFSHQDYNEKLLAALHHTIPERRIIAAQILGNLKIQQAVPEFKKILEMEREDYYFLRAILTALAKIEHPEQIEIIQKAAHHPSGLVSSYAKMILEKIKLGENLDGWDHFTG
jgi:HEAT repeat protein